MATPKTILLNEQNAVHQELQMTASQAILPGHLCALVAAGTVSKHATAAGQCLALFAVENLADGSSITDAYADGETVQLVSAGTGTRIYGILTTSQTITAGAILESAGNGTLRAVTAYSAGVTDSGHGIAVALESVTTTGATARIKIEVL